MKIKSLLKSGALILALIAYAQMLLGQNSTNSALTASGGSMSSGSTTIEYSFGEIFAAPSVSNAHTVGSGVIQPTYIIINGIGEAFDKKYHLKAYPNPVADADALTIETDDCKDFKTVEVFNALGQRLQNTAFNYQPIALSHLPKGEYLIVLRSNFIFKSVKIIKQ